MDEAIGTYFQIKPGETWPKNVQFMNYCFDIGSVTRITPVTMVASQLYTFDIQFYDREPITLSFLTKAKGLKAQRELARAYTKTGEFSEDTEAAPIPQSGTTGTQEL